MLDLASKRGRYFWAAVTFGQPLRSGSRYCGVAKRRLYLSGRCTKEGVYRCYWTSLWGPYWENIGRVLLLQVYGPSLIYYAIFAELLPTFLVTVTTKKGFYSMSKCFLLNFFSRTQISEFSSRAVHLSGPYSKIRTAPGTNQNAPFHLGPVQPYNKYPFTMLRSCHRQFQECHYCFSRLIIIFIYCLCFRMQICFEWPY